MEIEINGEVYVRYSVKKPKRSNALNRLLMVSAAFGVDVSGLRSSSKGVSDQAVINEFTLITEKKSTKPANTRSWWAREFHSRFMLKSEFEQRMAEQEKEDADKEQSSEEPETNKVIPFNPKSVEQMDSAAKDGLQFSPVELKEEYRNEWNILDGGFGFLTMNGEPIRNTLYRAGGHGGLNPDKPYSMLLKYTQAFYSKEIMAMSSKNGSKRSNKHLESRWCIVDQFGNEKVVEKEKYSSGFYLVDNSCLYLEGDNIYNIETGHCYGYSRGRIESDNFIFIHDRKKDENGTYIKFVTKINKQDGSWESFI